MAKWGQGHVPTPSIIYLKSQAVFESVRVRCSCGRNDYIQTTTNTLRSLYGLNRAPLTTIWPVFPLIYRYLSKTR